MTRPKILDHRFAPAAVSMLFCVLIFASFLGVERSGALQFFELPLYDVWLRLVRADPEPCPDVLVIGITDDDIAQQKQTAPSDYQLAELLRKLQRFNVRAVGLDLIRDMRYLDRVQDAKVARGPYELDEILRSDPRIIAVSRLPRPNQPELELPAGLTFENGRVALADVIEDPDGIVRRAAIGLSYERLTPDMDGDGKRGDAVPSLAFQLATIALASEGMTPQLLNEYEGDVRLAIGKAVFTPVGHKDGGYAGDGKDFAGFTFLLDYEGWRPISEGDSVTWMDWLHTAHLQQSDVENKVVLIGKRSKVDKDYFDAPIGRDQYGVDLHAMAVDQLLRAARFGGRQPRVWSGWAEALYLLGWTLLAGAAGLWVRRPLQFAALVVFGLLAILGTALWAFSAGWWIPAVPSLLSWFTTGAFITSYAAYREARVGAVVDGILRTTMDPAIAKYMKENAEAFSKGGKLLSQPLTATVLFTDIKGFSAMAARVPDEKLMPWLNNYMASMSTLVGKHKGVVNKYIGDAIMAVFGVPVPRTTVAEQAEDAERAVRCALAMRGELAVLNAKYKQAGDPLVDGMRIGIHTGKLVAGGLGSADRLEYTVIGDTVNTASRLESLKVEGDAAEAVALIDKDPEICSEGCRILMSDSTRDLVKDRFRVKRSELPLKGIGTVAVYGVVAEIVRAAAEAPADKVPGVATSATPVAPARAAAAAAASAGAATPQPAAAAPHDDHDEEELGLLT